MILEDRVDSEDEVPELGDSDSLYTDSSTSSSSESEIESDSEQEQNPVVPNSPERPRKWVRTRGGLAFRGALAPRPTNDHAQPIARPESIPGNNQAENSDMKENPWNDKPNIVKVFDFNEEPGLKIDMENKEPVDFFNLFVTEELINVMVVKTNRYAEQEIEKQRPLKRSSWLKDWKPINAEEMRLFLGTLLHMGSVKLPSFEHYWSKNKLYKFPVLSKVMSRNKFQLMLRFWHFVDNETTVGGRLNKMQLLTDQLNGTMANTYTPDKKFSLDESMMERTPHIQAICKKQTTQIRR